MSTESSAPAPAASVSHAELANVLSALQSRSGGTSPMLLVVMGFQTLVIGAVLALLVYQHLHPSAAAVPAPIDTLAAVKTAATEYRKDEAAAFRRVKAKLVRTGDVAKDRVALAQAIHDQRIAKAQALADSLTASTDWSAALEAAASAFEKTEAK